jgi:ABC-type glycerol-3-phosphate transport system substrate-binding protein
MRGAVAIIAAAALLAGCGGDDDAAGGDTAGASGAEGIVEGAPYDITVGEFLVELQPQKQEILDAFVADSEACAGVEVDNGFVLLVSAAAIDADHEAPLAGLVEEQC